MPAYLVTLDTNKSGYTLKDKANAVVVFAADATGAKQMASAHYDGDGTHFNSSDATVTEIAVAADWIGWTFRVTLVAVAGAAVYGPFEVIGVDEDSDTIDEIAALLVTAINAHDDIANAAYNSTTNVLTVAGTADGLGDHRLIAEIIPPGKTDSIASLVGTIVDKGVAAADVTVALPADAAVIPKVYAGLAQ